MENSASENFASENETCALCLKNKYCNHRFLNLPFCNTCGKKLYNGNILISESMKKGMLIFNDDSDDDSNDGSNDDSDDDSNDNYNKNDDDDSNDDPDTTSNFTSCKPEDPELMALDKIIKCKDILEIMIKNIGDNKTYKNIRKASSLLTFADYLLTR